MKDTRALYPVQKITNEFGIVLNKENLLKENNYIPEYKNSVVYISANDIRIELENNHIYPDHDTIFMVAELRIKTGLANGATVIFDASNIDRKNREHYINLAKTENINELKLVVSNSTKNNSSVPELYLEELKERFQDNYPSIKEGWTEIVEFHDHIKNVDLNEISR